MGNNVFANGREVACKASDGKSVCAFPDVCLTPPSPPAGPIPIPYPNTGMASDTAGGSKKVKMSNKEVMLKNKSYFKKSTGDEAATKAQGMGVVTHQIQGKIYFNSWSMDVKVEGQNVVRQLDLTTHNHASPPGQTPPFPHLSAAAIGRPPECEDLEVTLQATVAEELPPSRTKGATVGLAVVQGNPGSLMGGASSISSSTVKRGGKYSHWSSGIKRGEESNVKTCDGEKFEYNDGGRPKQGHAEAKMIEDWFKNGAPGKLVINVSKAPCEDCSRLINEINKGQKSGKNCDKIVVCA